jgi:hypothetical protein
VSEPHILKLTAGRPVIGLWCDKCALPSRYEVPIYALQDDGPRRIGLVDRCDGCSEHTL